MNPTVDNDLQKAIDDITKNTNEDPVFADPVAAPSSIPEGDSGVMGQPIGPFPSREPVAPVAPIAPEPVMSSEPAAPVAEPAAPVAEPFAPAEPAMPAPIVDSTSNAETFAEPAAPEFAAAPSPIAAPDITLEPIANASSSADIAPNADAKEIRDAILRDLAPVMDKVELDPSKKFNLYKNIHEDLRDDSVIAPAYNTAKEIADDAERADALLYLYDSLDNAA